MALGLLAGLAIPFITDLIKEHGTDLATKGIEKVTGLDLSKESLTPEAKQLIIDSEYRLKELDFQKLKIELEQEVKQEETRTKRWESDNKAGGINAKVRPYTLIYLLFVVTLFALTDGNAGEFAIKEAWTVLFTSLAITAFGGYFVLRTYEKKNGKS